METKAETEKKQSPHQKETKGAKIVIESLLAENVDTIFGYPGGAIMPIYDVLYDYQDQINHILTRHEQGAIHAAEAYAKVSGKVGVVFATSGPGATNLITGLANALMDSTPLVCITAQVPSSLLGYDAFQETDVIGVSMPVTKWNYQITKAEEIIPTLAKAFYIAKTGRPGPVLIDITKDAELQFSKGTYKKANKVSAYYPYPKLSEDKIREAAQLINEAKRPLILAGQGIKISQAEKQLLTLAEKADIPVAATLHGLTTFPNAHKLYVGMLGMHGNYAPNKLTNESDVIIAIGMRFDDRVTGKVDTYARNSKIIHIDIDIAEFDKIIKTDVEVQGDAKQVLTKLLCYIKENQHSDWIKKFDDFNTQEYDKVIEQSIHPNSKELKMAEVVHLFSEKTHGDAIVVTDVGQNQMMAARYYKFNQSNCFITSGGLGTMGFGLPAALGAAIAAPDKTVILFVGDGGLQMTIQELNTIRIHAPNVKIVLLNNNYLGMVRQWQQLFNDKRYAATTLNNPDLTAVANAYGIEAIKVTDREDLEKNINYILKSGKASFLEVMVEKEDNVFPMVPPGATISDAILEA